MHLFFNTITAVNRCWRRAAITTIALLSSVLTCAAAGQIIKSRTPVAIGTYPWSAVGKLFNSVGGACTASVLGPKTALTAAHCLFNFRTKRFLPPEAIHFLIGYDRGHYKVHARIDRYRIGNGYDPTAEKKTIQFDWALLHLTKPLTGNKILHLSHQNPDAGEHIILAGFQQQRAYILTADLNCAVLETPSSKFFLSNCVALPGDSGGPILIESADGVYRILGMQIATAKLHTRQNRNVTLAISDTVLEKALHANTIRSQKKRRF